MSGHTENASHSTSAKPWRRALPRWAQIAVLLAVFVAGGVVGAVVSIRAVHSRIEHYRQHPGELPDEVVPRLAKRLSLTERQAGQVLEVFRRRHSRIVALHGQVSAEIHEEFSRLERDVAAILENDEQREAWREAAERVRRVFLPPRRRGTALEESSVER